MRDPRNLPPVAAAPPLTVSRRAIASRGWHLRCPNCGAKSLLLGYFKPAERCDKCGLAFEREEGFFLGALVISYAVTCLAGPLPALILWLLGVLPPAAAWLLAGASAVVIPIAFFPVSRSWNLALYYLVLPDHLPANAPGTPLRADE